MTYYVIATRKEGGKESETTHYQYNTDKSNRGEVVTKSALRSTVVKSVLAIGALTYLSTHAFTKEVRRTIGERDKWTCQSCGNKSEKGWMMDAAHIDHDKKNGNYSNPNNGEIKCVLCHLENHVQMFLDNPNDYNEASLRLITGRAISRGLHYKSYYRTHPFARRKDNKKVRKLLESYDLDLEAVLEIN